MHTGVETDRSVRRKHTRSHGMALLEVLFALSILLLFLSTLLHENQQLLKQFGHAEKKLRLQKAFEAAGSLLLWQLQAMPLEGETISIPLSEAYPLDSVSASCTRAGTSVDRAYLFITCALRESARNEIASTIQTYWLPSESRHDL